MKIPAIIYSELSHTAAPPKFWDKLGLAQEIDGTIRNKAQKWPNDVISVIFLGQTGWAPILKDGVIWIRVYYEILEWNNSLTIIIRARFDLSSVLN